MRNLAQLLADPTLQRRVHETMRHFEPFRAPDRLPDHLQRRLDELDRVIAEREGTPDRG